MSTHIRHRTKTLFVYPWWQSAVIVILLLGDTYAVMTSLTCPGSYFNGQNVSVVCVVDIDDVAKICSFPTAVNYLLKSVTGLSEDRCSTSYPSCSPPAGADRCGCVNQSSTAYTYVYNFVANETLHKGGNITCVIDCLLSGTATTQYFGNCISISFDQHTSSTSSTNAAEQTNSSPSTPSSNGTGQTNSTTSSSVSASSNVKEENRISDGCDTGCKTGLGVGLGVGIPVVIIIIVCVAKKTNLCCSNTPNTMTATPHTTTTTTTTPNTTTNTENGRGGDKPSAGAQSTNSHETGKK